mmetsp:Transcript_21559/g.56203  ORF Transcript_21559/g.56203 Transcript_21559/m.56203 type:complete len:253 (+) Transcript_21559:347-1105(+)
MVGLVGDELLTVLPFAEPLELHHLGAVAELEGGRLLLLRPRDPGLRNGHLVGGGLDDVVPPDDGSVQEGDRPRHQLAAVVRRGHDLGGVGRGVPPGLVPCDAPLLDLVKQLGRQGTPAEVGGNHRERLLVPGDLVVADAVQLLEGSHLAGVHLERAVVVVGALGGVGSNLEVSCKAGLEPGDALHDLASPRISSVLKLGEISLLDGHGVGLLGDLNLDRGAVLVQPVEVGLKAGRLAIEPLGSLGDRGAGRS